MPSGCHVCKPSSLSFTVLVARERVVQRYGTQMSFLHVYMLFSLLMFCLCVCVSSVCENLCLFLSIGGLSRVCPLSSHGSGSGSYQLFSSFFFLFVLKAIMLYMLSTCERCGEQLCVLNISCRNVVHTVNCHNVFFPVFMCGLFSHLESVGCLPCTVCRFSITWCFSFIVFFFFVCVFFLLLFFFHFTICCYESQLNDFFFS